MDYRRKRLAIIVICGAVAGVSLALNIVPLFLITVLSLFLIDRYIVKKAIEKGEIIYDERDIYIENLVNSYSFKAFITILLIMYFTWLIDKSLSLNLVYNITLFREAPWFAILMLIVHATIRTVIRWKHRV